MRAKRMNGLVALAAMAVTGVAGAQSITPDKFSASIGVGDTVTINKTITLPRAGATKVDVFFLVDTTGSMKGIIGNAQLGATAIMTALPSGYRFGVGQYNGDPLAEGESRATAYSQITGLTSNKTAVQAGIDSLAICMFSCGGDFPEANFYGLSSAAVGDVANGGAPPAAWDAASQRLIVWFGDAPSHVATISEAATVANLDAANVKVVAFNSVAADRGIDQGGQASAIVAATDGSLTNNFILLSAEQFATKVTDEITAASSFVDLAFGSTFVGDGLEISFACTDALGCDNVAGGGSRTFEVAITGKKPGEYKFDVFARGVDAVESDVIRVVGVPAIPEPTTYALMAMGLAVVGFVSRRRNGTSRPA
jgi:PEP-CTERM motif